MDNMILKSELLTVTKINRKTKAKMFEHLVVGDIIEFSVPIKEAGRNSGTYATYIKATNIKTGETTSSSFNQLPAVLKAFEFDAVKNDFRYTPCITYEIGDKFINKEGNAFIVTETT